jgi:hypothetical protein
MAFSWNVRLYSWAERYQYDATSQKKAVFTIKKTAVYHPVASLSLCVGVQIWGKGNTDGRYQTQRERT